MAVFTETKSGLLIPLLKYAVITTDHEYSIKNINTIIHKLCGLSNHECSGSNNINSASAVFYSVKSERANVKLILDTKNHDKVINILADDDGLRSLSNYTNIEGSYLIIQGATTSNRIIKIKVNPEDNIIISSIDDLSPSKILSWIEFNKFIERLNKFGIESGVIFEIENLDEIWQIIKGMKSCNCCWSINSVDDMKFMQFGRNINCVLIHLETNTLDD